MNTMRIAFTEKREPRHCPACKCNQGRMQFRLPTREIPKKCLTQRPPQTVLASFQFHVTHSTREKGDFSMRDCFLPTSLGKSETSTPSSPAARRGARRRAGCSARSSPRWWGRPNRGRSQYRPNRADRQRNRRPLSRSV